jgi:translin
MRNLKKIAGAIEKELDEKNARREDALRGSRELIRLSKKIISSMGKKGADGNTRSLLNKITKDAQRLKKRLERHPDLYHSGAVGSALAEVVEVSVLFAILKNGPLPTPDELGATAEAYLLGLGDVIGELRRKAVDALRNDQLKSAERLLSQMETLYNVLMRFDYPDALVSLRRKQDIARGVVERTRGEILVATRERALKEKMDRVIASVEGPAGTRKTQEGQKKGKRKRRRERTKKRRHRKSSGK